MKKLEVTSDNKIYRRYTPDWAEKGNKKYEEIADFGNSLIRQRKHLVEYIELLHDKIDEILKENEKLKKV